MKDSDIRIFKLELVSACSPFPLLVRLELCRFLGDYSSVDQSGIGLHSDDLVPEDTISIEPTGKDYSDPTHVIRNPSEPNTLSVPAFLIDNTQSDFSDFFPRDFCGREL